MPTKKKAKKKRAKPQKKGKLQKIRKLLNNVSELCTLLEDCGFHADERTYSTISELQSHADEIDKMFVRLLGDKWWLLRLPPKKEAPSA